MSNSVDNPYNWFVWNILPEKGGSYKHKTTYGTVIQDRGTEKGHSFKTIEYQEGTVIQDNRVPGKDGHSG